MVIKTRTAAMGIRGTEFAATYNVNNQNSSLLVFKGKVKMVQSTPKVIEPDDVVQELKKKEAVDVKMAEFTNTHGWEPGETT
jgi:hypothetical protein